MFLQLFIPSITKSLASVTAHSNVKMLFLTLLFFLTTSGLAAPANHLQERQKDTTYTVTCLGPLCTDYPPTTFVPPTSTPKVPGGEPSKSSTTPKTTSKTTAISSMKKTSSTSKYAQPSSTASSKTTRSTEKPTKTTATGEVGPSSTKCPVPLYYQCGGYYDGKPWTGCTKCAEGAQCVEDSDFYAQCVAKDD